MIDGKIINYVSNTNSTSKCYICGAMPSKMNDLAAMKARLIHVKVDHFQYGLSPLHARIKFLECILKISYRLELPNDKKPKGMNDLTIFHVLPKYLRQDYMLFSFGNFAIGVYFCGYAII